MYEVTNPNAKILSGNIPPILRRTSQDHLLGCIFPWNFGIPIAILTFKKTLLHFQMTPQEDRFCESISWYESQNFRIGVLLFCIWTWAMFCFYVLWKSCQSSWLTIFPVQMMKKCHSNRGFFIPHFKKTWRSLVKTTMAIRLIAPTRSIKGSRKPCPNEFQNYLQHSLKGAVSGQVNLEASMV